MSKPIALQLYTVREAMNANWQTVLRQIADIGYMGVETAGFSHASISETKALLDQLGLQVIAAHGPLPLGDQQQAVLDMMATLDCQRLVCGGTGHDQFGSETTIKQQATLFNEANAIAQAHGLQFGLHNHWWEFGHVNGRLAFDILFDHLDDTIFFEVDTYWATVAQVNPTKLINQLGSRAPLLHIKDGPGVLNEPHVAVGQGVMDFPAILTANQHADWLIIELDHCATDMITAVAQSYTYLTTNKLARGKK